MVEGEQKNNPPICLFHTEVKHLTCGIGKIGGLFLA